MASPAKPATQPRTPLNRDRVLRAAVALAGIGTAVTLYPVVKRQNEGVALGFVAARVLEAGMIFTGVISLLSLGVWLVVKGFRPCPITAGMTAADTAPAYHDVTA